MKKIEPDLSRWQNFKLWLWLSGMDLFAPLYWGRWRTAWGARAYLYCVAEAGAMSYDPPPDGPAGPDPF